MALSIITLSCYSCSSPAQQAPPSRSGTVRPQQTPVGRMMPLTDSAPPQGEMTPTVPATVPTPRRVLVTATPKPTPRRIRILQRTVIDDSIQGTDTNQFNYVGSGWKHNSNLCMSNPCEYNNDNSWDNTTNDYVTISFTGVQIKFYGVVDPEHGIGAASIDGGDETMIDFYAATRAGDQLLWTSSGLSAGTHTFKLRVTGNKNPCSSSSYVTVDRVDILS